MIRTISNGINTHHDGIAMFMFKETGITGLEMRMNTTDTRHTLKFNNAGAVMSWNYTSLILSNFKTIINISYFVASLQEIALETCQPNHI